MKRKTQFPKISYEPEADVLSWELSKKPIDFAREAGNFVVHFNQESIPVLVEFLEASRFFSWAQQLVKKRGKIAKV